MAKTIYGEARGEYNSSISLLSKSFTVGLAGLYAVGLVILNRLSKPNRFGKSIEDICLKAYQFSCWNKNDPNCAKLQNLNIQSVDFIPSLEVARYLCTKTQYPILDLTNGADHYHDISIDPPFWTKTMICTCQIGCHRFYKSL